MKRLPIRTTRLSILVLTPTFERLQRAAKLAGQTLGEFLVMALLEKSEQVLEGERHHVLTQRTARRVLKGMATNFNPPVTRRTKNARALKKRG
jgi:uncharacterized protein (DUF1778 family)